MAIDKTNLATVQLMWRREVEAAATYRHLANRERDPVRKDILIRLADQEDKHAAPPPRDTPPIRRKSNAGCRGFSGSPIRTSSCTASNRRRTRRKPNTTS